MDRHAMRIWSVLLLSVAMPALAADLTGCIKFTVQADGAASLANVCSGRLNLLYCVDNPGSARLCSKTPGSVTTLSPAAVERIPSYTADGAGTVYWAVCAYPEAPINWKPGPDGPFICRKTCVMC